MNDRILRERRTLIVSSFATAGTLIVARSALAQSNDACKPGSVLTPRATEGPFYPVMKLPDSNVDLTQVAGKATRARGQHIVIRGRVLRQDCKAVANTSVEMWQASESGRYMHPNDRNTRAELDPNFQYFARAVTDSEGRFVMRTVRPGRYPGRTPHCHFRIEPPGLPSLSTQMYFGGDQGNAEDGIYLDVPVAQRPGVTIDFKPLPEDSRLLVGYFDIFV
jgi:protocatechuate 3,4-dioxygenase beta subunit